MLSAIAARGLRPVGGTMLRNYAMAAHRAPMLRTAAPALPTATPMAAFRPIARQFAQAAEGAAVKAKPKRRFFKTKVFLTLWALTAVGDNIINDDFDTLFDRIRPKLTEEQRKDRPHIVILGTGWGALSMLRKLRADQFNVTIVSPRNYFLFTPLLPSTTTGFINIQAITEPIRDYCRRANASNAVIYEADCYEIDPDKNIVKCTRTNRQGVKEADFELAYDQLIVAVGCQTATFGIPGVQEHAFFMKEAPDARRLRARIMDVLETANLPNAAQHHNLDQFLHFVVVGGGPTGVECAAELHDMIDDEVKLFFPNIADKVKITLVEAQPHLLSMFSRSLVEYSEERFQREQINVITDALVTSVDDNNVTIKHLDTKTTEQIPYGTLLWASGIATRPVVKNLMQKIGKENGQTSPRALCIDDHCLVKGTKNIWALGDAAFNGLAPTAQVAGQEGKYLGRLFRYGADAMYKDKLEGTHKHFDEYLARSKPFKYQHMGSFAYVGEHSAIADFTTGKDEKVGPLGTSAGVTTFLIWRSVYFTKLLSFRNRCLLGVNWAFTTIFGRDTSRSR